MPAFSRTGTKQRLFGDVSGDVARFLARTSWEERVPVPMNEASITVHGEPATDRHD
jgi:hypothetical protein